MGKQPMTLQEAKLLRIAITNVSQYDEELMEYNIGIKKLALILGVTDANMYRDIKDICTKISRRTLEVRENTDDKKSSWKVYPWMRRASYSKETNIVTLRLNDEIKEYVIELERLFTRYKLINILALKSYYAIRIYEILISVFNKYKKRKKYFEFGVEELREMTGTEKKYVGIGQFKLRVLDIAVTEINKSTDLEISYKTKKTGRFITHIIFKVEEVIDQEIKEMILSDNDDISGTICGLLDTIGINNTLDQCSQLAKAYDNNIERFTKNLNYVVTRTDIGNFVAYLLTISKNDLSIP